MRLQERLPKTHTTLATPALAGAKAMDKGGRLALTLPVVDALGVLLNMGPSMPGLSIFRRLFLQCCGCPSGKRRRRHARSSGLVLREIEREGVSPRKGADICEKETPCSFDWPCRGPSYSQFSQPQRSAARIAPDRLQSRSLGKRGQFRRGRSRRLASRVSTILERLMTASLRPYDEALLRRSTSRNARDRRATTNCDQPRPPGESDRNWAATHSNLVP